MNIITKEKIFSKEWFSAYSFILIGALLMAVGYVFFVSPYKFAPGGVYGIAIVIHHLTVGVFNFAPDGLPIGMMALAMDIASMNPTIEITMALVKRLPAIVKSISGSCIEGRPEGIIPTTLPVQARPVSSTAFLAAELTS